MQRFIAICLALFLVAMAGLCQAQDGVRVEFFSPQGTIKSVRQVTARFSEPMTTFGDPRYESPFEIACPEKGSGRWTDVKNWVFDFERDLPSGIACSFMLREGLKTIAGTAVSGERTFSFTTGGPAIVGSRPGNGKTIDEDQIFILTLDGDADEASVLANVRFSVEGMVETLGIQIVKGAERTAVLKATARPDNGRTLIIRCRQSFPSKAAVKLIWGSGIASTTGVTSGVEQIFTFTVRDQFTISFQCDRTNANAPCIPMTPMRLSFSSPVPANLAKKIVMKSGKKVYKPELAGDDEEGEETVKTAGDVRGVKFKGPFPEKKSFVIELPKGLTDDAGRSPANRAKFPLHVSTDGFPPLAKFAAPFGIVELNNESAIPVTLRNVEPRIKARQLNPDEPQRIIEEKPKETRETVIDKARAVGEKLTSWLSGSKKKKEEKAGAIKGKRQLLPVDREEKIIEWLRKVRTARRNKPILKGEGAEDIVIPKPNGEKAFEVVGIPIKKAGFHVVELESPILGTALLDKFRPMYVSSAALVTNMSAHFKWGRESSLVWVTSLDKGLPVAGAEVNIRDCKGKLHWQGKTDADGIARIKTKLSHELPFCSDSDGKSEKEEDYYTDNEQPMLQGMSGGLFVFARKQDDLTFVHSSWDRGIENWRFNLPSDEFREHTIAHTVFARTLVRAGDTVHMKHFMRNHAMKGFDLRNVTDLPQVVLVKHRGSGQRYEFPLKWKADNTAETRMTVPKGAGPGFYDVYLSQKPSGKPKKTAIGSYEEGDAQFFAVDGWQSGFFRVEEFRVPLMKGVVEPPKEPAVNASSIDIDLYVSHLAGGGAGGAPVKLRTQVRPRSVSFDDYEDYTFANGKVEAGVVKEESPDRFYDDEGEDANQEVQPKKPIYRTQELVLDKTGAFRAKIDDLPKITAPHSLVAELEFRDPNGEIQTVTGRVPLWSSGQLVGIKPDSWSSSADSLKFKTVVVDIKGTPVRRAKVNVELFSRRHFSHRKRLVGGFYSYEHVTETKSVGPICEGITDDKGLLDCSAKAPVSGNVILQATVTDEGGNTSSSNRDVWIVGKGEWWFEAGDSDRIDLLPEKKSYNPGDAAKFQVRSPFRSATVLVTVEREGVIDAYVKKISGKEPVISVPVKGNYTPNVFVSALCVRGRVAGTKPTALFDPGKPAYRLGISEIRVGRKAHELNVKVSADSDTYKVRGKARIRIKVTSGSVGTLPKGAEVAVAAVDEGLLELMPNNSWKLLDAMMGRRGHEIETSTAQTQVVGRRHYGLKALPAGGGGGMRSARELFDTLLAWKGRVKLDAKGEATLEIPLNDSLTSFSVVAVASAGTGLFGTGRTTFRTTQDLMVLSGLPPLVRQGDRFTALFTIRNASSRDMSLSVTARPSWSDGAGFEPIALKLAPGEAKDVSWPAEVPAGIESMTWEAQVREENGDGADRIKVSQRVVAAVPVQVYQATVTQVDKGFELDVRMPDDAVKGRGGINVVMRSKLTEGLGGVVHYMKSYPYSCMEQMVSRAISLKDDTVWKQIVTVLPSYLDSDGLVKYFPSPWLDGNPVLTAYILSISKEAGRDLPDNLIRQMEKGLVAFIEGKIRRESSLRTADLSIQKLAAVEALSQRGRASAKLLSSVAVEPNLWPTSAVLDWLNVLKRTHDLPDRIKRLKEAEQIIRSRLNFQGTVMNFSTEQSDRLWWLMVSTDTNALRTLLTFMDEGTWRSDMPRLVRGAVARQQQGRWETTIANAWGVVALDRFSKKFEATPVTGSTKAEMAGTAKSTDWGKDKKGKTLSFPWPEGTMKVSLRHTGGGKPWATLLSLAAIPLKEPLFSGYRIKKTVTPIEQRDKNRWSRGDVARVRLEIEAQSDMTWVAVSDPVPAGTTILGSGLGRDSAIMAEGGRNRSWPVFDERSFEAYRAYYDYLPKGKFVTEYTVRFNNEGNFRLPPTRVEALYAPEMYGETPNLPLSVGE
ncbi:MAG: alpha-2-macroglobulin domain-containing protein [Geobacteraceae bacterium]|nr:MAG: alpha-2-macroglobulin domain-containing protein [Geobacteraceae bacterium]